MQLTATIEIEFEMEDGQPENAAKAALARGVGELANSIERGLTGRTGVKARSTKTKIVQQNIVT